MTFNKQDSIGRLMQNYLDQVDNPADLKNLSTAELSQLAQEVRKVLIQSIMHDGGHLGSNLGVIELTIALHYVFSAPEDKLIFDVSHQTYTHKMLTGRKKSYTEFDSEFKVSGFSNPQESIYDHFELGHTSTSVSLALGMAKARDLTKESHEVVCVIGDGALSGGQAWEGLDNAACAKSKLIIIVNDNDMSIAPNQGGIYNNLRMLRETQGKGQPNFFTSIGLDYLYVQDGHDIAELVATFKKAKTRASSVVIHVPTIKGKGLEWAEKNQEATHKISKGGIVPDCPSKNTYEEMTARYLENRMQSDPRLLVVSPATPRANGLSPEFRAMAAEHFVDCGIAEEHAVGYISGAGAGGAHPVLLAYSTFMQRAYDQIMQDLALNNSPATIVLFRSGIEGGPATHSGIYDIPMMSNIPNLKCLAPTCAEEYLSMLNWSLDQTEGPVVIRVPRIMAHTTSPQPTSWTGSVTYKTEQQGSKVALLALGDTLSLALQAADTLKETNGIEITVVNPRTYSELDCAYLNQLKNAHHTVITLENGQLSGGFGEHVARFYGSDSIKVHCLGTKKLFFDYVGKDQEFQDAQLTPTAIEKLVKSSL